MRIIFVLLIFAVIVGSPLWISMAILIVPFRWWFIDFLLCGLQALIAYGWWWFWWGGGIGAEAHPSPAGQWVCLLAIVPIALAIAKRVIVRAAIGSRGFPVVDIAKNNASELTPRH